ncbi:MAG: MFS transporter [Planctomycetota bacterium]|jgi:MFS family permease
MTKSGNSFLRIAIYLFPFLSDVLFGLFPFVCAVRAAKMGASARDVGLLATALGASYMISSPLVGRILTTGNAWILMVISGAGQLMVSVLFTVFPSLTAMYILLPLGSCMAAFFFVPFQIFMKAVDNEKKPLVYSVGMYTLSWSLGMATGPLISGFLMQYFWQNDPEGWKYCYGFSSIVAVLLVFGVFLARKFTDDNEQNTDLSDPVEHEIKPDKEIQNNYSSAPDLAWLGWICCGIGMLVLFHIKAIYPKHSEVLGLKDSTKGMVLFLLSGVQAFTGFLLCWSKDWMFDKYKILGFGIFGVIAAGLFSVGRDPVDFYIAATLYGIYSGSFFFYFVFHSLTHPQKTTRYIAINEMVVGILGLLAPLVGGILSDEVSFKAGYQILGAVLVVGLIYQFVIHGRNSFRIKISSDKVEYE